MVGVAHVAAHRQSEQLAHEMILESRADDLPFVEQVFRADESNHAVYQHGRECPGNPVRPRLERNLIDSVMGFSRQCATLSGLEVHGLVANPANVVTLAMM